MQASRQYQRGAAIITALLVVMLAATIATYLLAQQSQALTRTARATERAQVALYATPTLDWARQVLYEARNNGFDARTQAWAQPIAAQPLLSGEGVNIFASGLIGDEAGKFNLFNLMKDSNTVSEEDVKVFQQLLKNLKLNPDLTDAVLDWLDADNEQRPNGAENSYYMNLTAPLPYRAANQPMVQWQELARIKGFDETVLRRLAPYISALPSRTKININTASLELLAAVFPKLTSDEIADLVRQREKNPFKSIAFIKEQPTLKSEGAAIDQMLDVKSRYFLVSFAITGEAAATRQTALLERLDPKLPGWPRIIWVQAQ